MVAGSIYIWISQFVISNIPFLYLTFAINGGWHHLSVSHLEPIMY